MKILVMVLVSSMAFLSTGEKPIKIKPKNHINIKIQEPSDLAFSKSTNSLFIVSDNGLLYETDLEGKVKRKADLKGVDFEGVWCDEQHVYVVSEMFRNVYTLDKTNLKLLTTQHINYSGGRNKGFESITYNEVKKKFVMLTETDPITIYELDDNFQANNKIPFEAARDISAATWFDDKLWLLSDEDMTVFRLNPNNYEVEASWKIPIINPEGLAFDRQGNMLIVSDDMERLYFFDKP